MNIGFGMGAGLNHRALYKYPNKTFALNDYDSSYSATLGPLSASYGRDDKSKKEYVFNPWKIIIGK